MQNHFTDSLHNTAPCLSISVYQPALNSIVVSSRKHNNDRTVACVIQSIKTNLYSPVHRKRIRDA